MPAGGSFDPLHVEVDGPDGTGGSRCAPRHEPAPLASPDAPPGPGAALRSAAGTHRNLDSPDPVQNTGTGAPNARTAGSARASILSTRAQELLESGNRLFVHRALPFALLTESCYSIVH